MKGSLSATGAPRTSKHLQGKGYLTQKGEIQEGCLEQVTAQQWAAFWREKPIRTGTAEEKLERREVCGESPVLGDDCLSLKTILTVPPLGTAVQRCWCHRLRMATGTWFLVNVSQT
jgi:hypothetical protein